MKILIWGTGNSAKKLLSNHIKGEIIGFIETVPTRAEYKGLPVYSPTDIQVNYEMIFVASVFSNEILKIIEKNKIPLNKVCFRHLPTKSVIDENENLKRASRVFSEENMTFIEGYEHNKEINFVYKDLAVYNKHNKRESFQYEEKYKRFIYTDKYSEAGSLGTYFWQDLWAAKLIKENNPTVHYDIGSRIDGFIGHLLSFRKNIVLIDVRPLKNKVPDLNFICDDATNLNNIEDESIESISALCSLEHFGLGRYGDPIDPEACFKVFASIQKKLKPGGMTYISVPIGKEHLEFNAHRVFYASTIIEAFNQMELVHFDVADNDAIEYNVEINRYDNCEKISGSRFGLFCFKKQIL